MPDKIQIPVFRVMQIGKPAIDKRPHEIDRQRSSLVTAQQQLRVRNAVLRGKRAWYVKRVSFEDKRGPIRSDVTSFIGKPDKNKRGRLTA